MRIGIASRVHGLIAIVASLLVSAGPAAAATDPACPADLPARMRAVRLHEYGGPEQLRLDSIARPSPGQDEVLVRVAYASVNPIDWKLRAGLAKNWWPLTFPAVLGRDISGVVVAVGRGVTGWHCGDEVVAYLDQTKQGGYAEFVATRVDDLAPKPAKLSFAEAAAYPLVAMTAWQSLIDEGGLKSGERVLIHGGAGGVGSMAVQIAKAHGAYVVATGSARNHEYLKQIGADEVIDYRATPFESATSDIDLVLDTVGGDTTARSLKVIKRGGRLVSIAGRAPAEACASAGVVCGGGLAKGDPAALRKIGELFEQGRIRVNVDGKFPLERAGDAQELNRAGHTRGKIVLQVATDAI